jgi:hypothetical protein
VHLSGDAENYFGRLNNNEGEVLFDWFVIAFTLKFLQG